MNTGASVCLRKKLNEKSKSELIELIVAVRVGMELIFDSIEDCNTDILMNVLESEEDIADEAIKLSQEHFLKVKKN